MAKTFKMKKIAVGETDWKVWALDDNGRLWSLAASTNPAGLEWANEEIGGAVQLSVDGAGNVWTVNAKGEVHMRQAGQGTAFLGKWVARPAPASVKAVDIAAGKSEVMLITDKAVVRRWDGSAWAEDRVTQNIQDLGSGGPGVAYCINTSGQIYKSKPDGWDGPKFTVSGVKQLEVGFDNTLMYLGSDDHVNQLKGTELERDAIGAGVDLAVRTLDDIWVINAAGEIWRRTSSPFTSALIVGTPGKVTIGGHEYTWSHIQGPDFSKARVYWIQQGDTFDHLAADFGMTPAALKAKNAQIKNTNAITAGDPLRLV